MVPETSQVGWAWEELSEVLQCELANRADRGEEGERGGDRHKILVIWSYTVVICLALLPVASRLGVRAERASEVAEEALSEFYAASDAPGTLDGPLMLAGPTDLGQINAEPATPVATPANAGQSPRI